jgi:hypothetical protein
MALPPRRVNITIISTLVARNANTLMDFGARCRCLKNSCERSGRLAHAVSFRCVPVPQRFVSDASLRERLKSWIAFPLWSPGKARTRKGNRMAQIPDENHSANKHGKHHVIVVHESMSPGRPWTQTLIHPSPEIRLKKRDLKF